jgi:hypothetical protein
VSSQYGREGEGGGGSCFSGRRLAVKPLGIRLRPPPQNACAGGAGAVTALQGARRGRGAPAPGGAGPALRGACLKSMRVPSGSTFSAAEPS